MRDFEFNGLIDFDNKIDDIMEDIKDEEDFDDDELEETYTSLSDFSDDLLDFTDIIKSHSLISRKELINYLSNTYKLNNKDENNDGYDSYYFTVGDGEVQLDINKEGKIKYIDAIGEFCCFNVTIYLNSEIGEDDYF